jgi:hypothetical protein
MASVRLWPCRSSPETTSKGGGAGAFGEVARLRAERVDGRKTGGVVGRDRESGAARRAPDGWYRSGVPAGDRGRQRSAEIFVVKALPAATTRGGSAWQTSKGVLPTGARAPKKGAGSVDGAVARSFTGKQGTHHGPSYRSWRRLKPSPTPHGPRDANHAGSIQSGHHCQPMTRSPRFDSPEAGDEPGCEWRVSRRPRCRLEMGPSGPFPRSKSNFHEGRPRRRVSALVLFVRLLRWCRCFLASR